MTQSERRLFLIEELAKEEKRYNFGEIPRDEETQKLYLRALFNVRMPIPASEEFLKIQDEYLKEEINEHGVVELESVKPINNNIYLWKGDITRLRCGAIVNAANSQMLGCFRPNHTCIDNCIHTFAGVQLRIECNEIMEKQGFEEPTGKAKITSAYNLPCDYIIHTVGPIVDGKLNKRHEKLLESSYLECLKLAEKNNIKSIAFCCISTGVFGYPQKEAAELAIKTVKNYIKENNSDIKVIFNVFKDTDFAIYSELLK